MRTRRPHTRRRLLTMSLMVLFSLTSPAVGDVVSGSSKIMELTATEGAMLDAVNKYISDQYDKLKILSQFSWERSKMVHRTSEDDTRKLAEHPNGAFMLIRDFVKRWSDMIKANPGLEAQLSSFAIPQEADYWEGAGSLVHLQRVYRLSASDMYKGDYFGHQGPSLDPLDAYEIGKKAFTSGYLVQSIDWLEVAVDVLKPLVLDGPPSSRGAASPYAVWLARAASLLGRGYLFQFRTKEAQEMFDLYSLYEPANGDVIQLKKDLELPPEQWINYSHTFDSADYNISMLCSRDKSQRVAKLLPWHVCRFKAARNCPYLRFKEEILSIAPYASVFYDVAHDDEMDAMKNFVKGTMKRGFIGSSSTPQTSSYRTSDVSWINSTQLKEATRLAQRISIITGLDVDDSKSAEPFQIANYGLGGHYGHHLDPLINKTGSRLATFLIYLTDVEKGGNTVFVKAGISVAPVKLWLYNTCRNVWRWKLIGHDIGYQTPDTVVFHCRNGMGLFWLNYTPALEEDVMSRHAGCPVVIGNKWITNKWIWATGNEWKRPCGPLYNSTHMDVEYLLTSTSCTT